MLRAVSSCVVILSSFGFKGVHHYLLVSTASVATGIKGVCHCGYRNKRCVIAAWSVRLTSVVVLLF